MLRQARNSSVAVPPPSRKKYMSRLEGMERYAGMPHQSHLRFGKIFLWILD